VGIARKFSAASSKKLFPIGPKIRDLGVSRVILARTGDRCKGLGRLAFRSEMPIIRIDSWYTTKAMLVAPPQQFSDRQKVDQQPANHVGKKRAILKLVIKGKGNLLFSWSIKRAYPLGINPLEESSEDSSRSFSSWCQLVNIQINGCSVERRTLGAKL